MSNVSIAIDRAVALYHMKKSWRLYCNMFVARFSRIL
jgi:hypothetical protein